MCIIIICLDSKLNTGTVLMYLAGCVAQCESQPNCCIWVLGDCRSISILQEWCSLHSEVRDGLGSPLSASQPMLACKMSFLGNTKQIHHLLERRWKVFVLFCAADGSVDPQSLTQLMEHSSALWLPTQPTNSTFQNSAWPETSISLGCGVVWNTDVRSGWRVFFLLSEWWDLDTTPFRLLTHNLSMIHVSYWRICQQSIHWNHPKPLHGVVWQYIYSMSYISILSVPSA